MTKQYGRPNEKTPKAWTSEYIDYNEKPATAGAEPISESKIKTEMSSQSNAPDLSEKTTKADVSKAPPVNPASGEGMDEDEVEAPVVKSEPTANGQSEKKRKHEDETPEERAERKKKKKEKKEAKKAKSS